MTKRKYSGQIKAGVILELDAILHKLDPNKYYDVNYDFKFTEVDEERNTITYEGTGNDGQPTQIDKINQYSGNYFVSPSNPEQDLTLQQAIKGLILVLGDTNNKSEMITREYVIEKLKRILDKSIVFHKGILVRVRNKEEE